jgi:hypothetical protein
MVEVVGVCEEADRPVETCEDEQRIDKGDVIRNEQGPPALGDMLASDHREPVESVCQKDQDEAQERVGQKSQRPEGPRRGLHRRGQEDTSGGKTEIGKEPGDQRARQNATEDEAIREGNDRAAPILR